MAQNVFDATFDANNRIDVNSFDWSHVNNLTTNLVVLLLYSVNLFLQKVHYVLIPSLVSN